MSASHHPYPWLRWFAILWLLMYLPSYAKAYGMLNFLFLCNLGVIISAVGLIAGNRLLIASQAVASPVVGIAWGLDVSWKLVTGDFLFGGADYMFDPQWPLFNRILSVYHIAWPLLMLYLVRRDGYDRRGWPLQAGIALFGFTAGRLLGSSEQNINFAWADPFFAQQHGPALFHIIGSWLIMVGVAYGLTHLLLCRLGGDRSSV